LKRCKDRSRCLKAGFNRTIEVKLELHHNILCSLFFLSPLALLCQSPSAATVRFHTTLGDIDVALLSSSAPKTVANFLNYVNRGAYNNSLIHRSVPGFIFQGGGYQVVNGSFNPIPSDPPVQNEFGVSNTRGTVAMAKLGSDPNSATNQWFFNEANNSGNLDNQNGGFTVFGRVINDASLAVMDKIAAVPIPSSGPYQSPFDQLPLVNWTGGQVQEANLVEVLSITQLDRTSVPTIAPNGIVTASNFGGFAYASPGSYIEIYGSNLGGDARGWASSDFSNGNAPTSLGNVSVTVNGRPAYVNYVSANQVNVQVPGITPAGGSVPVVVTYLGQPSASVMVSIKQFGAGLLAPAAFKVNDKQYVAAIHAANGTLVSDGQIPGIATAPAVPGETLTLYGIGFGPVNPSSVPIAGAIVRAPTTLANPYQIKIGTTVAQVSYAGLVQGLVGLYQFNVVVPSDAPSGDLPLEMTLGTETVPQTLFLPVQPAQK
jgi:uncharacterized protein (TIGR03437 family)